MKPVHIPCATPGCGNTAVSSDSRCEEHRGLYARPDRAKCAAPGCAELADIGVMCAKHVGLRAAVTPAPAVNKEPAAARPKGVLFDGATSAERKEMPMCEGLLDYFPDACAYVSFVSKKGNDQHNPGQPMHWARNKSGDHANCILRHLKDRGKFDEKGILHDGNLAWRAMANLQETLERIYGLPKPRRATTLPAPELPPQ